MATKAINKFTRLADNYAGPMLVLADIKNPNAKTGFSTRSMFQDSFLHFELLSPTQLVTHGPVIPVPTLPLNFVARNAYITFTNIFNAGQAVTNIRIRINEILFSWGLSWSQSETFTSAYIEYIKNGEPYTGGGGYYRKPNPYPGSVRAVIRYISKSYTRFFSDSGTGVFTEASMERLIDELVAASALVRVSLSLGTPDSYSNKVVWNDIPIEPGNLSIAGDIKDQLLENSNPMAIKIQDFVAVQPSVELKGLTLWLRGYFEVPYSEISANT